MAQIEFLYVSPTTDVETVHIGIFPPYGRYVRCEMTRNGENVFWHEADIEEGDVYYHFFLNRDFSYPVFNKIEDLASRRDPLKRSSKHIGTLPFCAIEFQGGIAPCLRAVTHHSWVTEVSVVTPRFGDFPFRRAFVYKNRTYWDVRLPDQAVSLPFAPRVCGQDREFYLHPSGELSPEMDREHLYRFQDPGPGVDDRTIPAGAVGYQIFPDRFSRCDHKEDPRLKSWGAPPKNDEFCGGNLRGIIGKLDYLKELGVDFLYLNPVFHAATAHRYDTIDYYQVDPLLGDDADLRALVNEAHDRDMAVALDLALNHCGTGFFAFRDVVEQGRDSRYRDWFHISDFPVQLGDSCSYRCWQGDASLPEFNFNHPEVREYLLKVARHWVEACDIDGYRLDTSTSLPMTFVAELSAQLRRLKTGFTLVGEVWHANVERLLDEGNIDGVTNYPLYWDVVVPLVQTEAPPLEGLADALLSWLFRIPSHCLDVSWNFLGNHDLPRVMSILKERRICEALLLLLFAIPGCPVLYYGDELGLEGLDDPENRGCMDWEAVDDASLALLVRKLTEIRKRLRHVFVGPLVSIPIACRQKRLLGLMRQSGGESALFLIHLGGEERMVDLGPVTGGVLAKDLLSGETLEETAPMAPFQNRVLYFNTMRRD